MNNSICCKFKKSSLIGVLIIDYMLMDSSFPYFGKDFFYWTKFGLSVLVILYAEFCTKKADDILESVCKKIRSMLLIPLFMMLLYSCFIWWTQKTATPYVTRGISNLISQVIPILLAIALVRIYKESIIRLIVIAICMMAFANYTMGIIVNGPGFLLQLLNVKSSETAYKELHEIAYIAGLLLIYYFDKKNHQLKNGWLVATLIVFFVAWKRIGIAAFIIALFFYIILKKVNKGSKEVSIFICGICAFAVSVLYVGMSATDSLSTMLNKYGINMMGRDVIYVYFRKFCSFSFAYEGRGIGFVSRQFNYLTWQDVGSMVALKQGLHNDLFTVYLEIGMIGFIVWAMYQLLYIPKKIKDRFGIRCAVRCFTYTIFSFVTYTTDNTLRYFVYQMVLTIIIAITCYETKKSNGCYVENIV